MAKLSDLQPIPLSSLLTNTRGPGSPLATASVVIAQDVLTEAKVVVYGKDLLEHIARTKVRHALKVMIVEVDFQSDELERLTTLIDFVHGRLGSAAG